MWCRSADRSYDAKILAFVKGWRPLKLINSLVGLVNIRVVSSIQKKKTNARNVESCLRLQPPGICKQIVWYIRSVRRLWICDAAVRRNMARLHADKCICRASGLSAFDGGAVMKFILHTFLLHFFFVVVTHRQQCVEIRKRHLVLQRRSTMRNHSVICCHDIMDIRKAVCRCRRR